MSLSKYHSINETGIYSSILRHFVKNGDNVYIISPIDRKGEEKEQIIKEDHSTIVTVRIWNMQKTNVLNKAISMLTIDRIYIHRIKQCLKGIRFDLVLYPTPPITLLKTVEYVKKRDHAETYLLLKDIFPQNAVDIGLMSTGGVRGLIYKRFRSQEKRLYAASDHIGCMSPANVRYVLEHNPEVNPGKVHVCPNTTDPADLSIPEAEKTEIRKKYGIPADRTVFVYGGNLGKPQGIPYIINCLKSQADNREAYFIIVGSGTEYGRLKEYLQDSHQGNMKLMQELSKEDYDCLISACDVGLIFLDHRFTIPNFPSRLLAYMQARMPVLACTDPNTDIGEVIVAGRFGWWCESNDADQFSKMIDTILRDEDLKQKGERAYAYFGNNYTSDKAYQIICSRIKHPAEGNR